MHSFVLTEVIQFIFKRNFIFMNIKITIKDGDSKPLLVHKNQLSQVQFKKKNALYQQPTKDKNIIKKEKSSVTTNKNSRDDKNLRQTNVRSSGQEEARVAGQRRLMEDLDKISKNQASLDMIHNSNNILQKQNQILYDNQKVIHQLVKNTQPKRSAQNDRSEDVEGILKNIKKEVDQMKKIKQEIEKASKQFLKTISDGNKTGKQVTFQGVNNVAEMNSNLKNLADISKNQLQGLQNLQGIKNLQNFNIEGYTQAINSLKRQIVQYQKESQQIQRQLKLRAAKLDQLNVAPNFNEQLLAPYQDYLKKKADSIDLHAMKDKIYQKIGHFDYGKFQYDISQIMAEVKGQMKEFQIVCKQYRVEVPQIKFDAKQMKNLDLKLPNALDEYKAERGIDFLANKQQNQSQELSQSRGKRRRTGQAVIIAKPEGKKTKKLPQAIRQLNSKPIDLSAQVKYQKTNQPTQKTILQNQRENDKKEVQRNMKKGKVKNQDDNFQKYLEYRAQEQLEMLYKQKQQRLKKMKNELLQTCKQEPQVYLNLNIQNQIKRQVSTQKKREDFKRPQQKRSVKKEELNSQQKELKPIHGNEGQVIKAIGTEVLKEKLKNILGQANQRRQQTQIPLNQHNVRQNQQPKLQNIAQNFLALINNTLTQVNNQISHTIQHKFEQRSLSKQKREYERKSPPKIQIPKLQQFKPPPVLNMQNLHNLQNLHQYNQGFIATQPIPKIAEQKIVPKNYQHLQIKDSLNYGDLQISDESYQQDFQ